MSERVAIRVLRVGVAGLGRAFTLMLPALSADPRVRVVAAADPRADARARFEAQFRARAYEDVAALCHDRDVDVVYVATPHEWHAEHAQMAARSGKHVLVEKPMALTLAECDAMIAAADVSGVRLIVGHSHSFDAPIRRARELIRSGAFGAVRMIHAFYYTDFLYRPRRPEELDTRRGGGVLWSQASHQVDIVRLLGGGLVTCVRALTGNWDPVRATEGAYAALLQFEGGAFASLVYSGYGRFDGDEFSNAVSELGLPKDCAAYGAARRMLAGAHDAAEEAALREARMYGGRAFRDAADTGPARLHEHFGTCIVSCERADLRPLPGGVLIYADDAIRLDALSPPAIARREVIDELYEAVVDDVAPVHDGRWSRATLEVCLALLASAREAREIPLRHQAAPAR